MCVFFVILLGIATLVFVIIDEQSDEDVITAGLMERELRDLPMLWREPNIPIMERALGGRSLRSIVIGSGFARFSRHLTVYLCGVK